MPARFHAFINRGGKTDRHPGARQNLSRTTGGGGSLRYSNPGAPTKGPGFYHLEMVYRQFAAPPDLEQWIECAWSLRGSLAPEGQAILPDGRTEMIFHLGDPPIGPDGSVQSRALITGQIRSALMIHGNGQTDTIGIRLRPEASGTFAPAVDLADRVHDLASVLGSSAVLAIEQVGNSREPVATAFDTVRSLTRNVPSTDPLVRASVEAIERQAGCGALDSCIPDSIGVRQWERRFSRATGLGPKGFARIARLQESIRLHESGQWPSWAEIALECGFYDQSHLANDFRAFTGQSPDRFFREGRALAEFYRDGIFQDRKLTGR